MRVFLIGIAGGSGSGKTTFAKKIINQVKDEAVGLLHQDSYYLPSPPQSLRMGDKSNFDHPDAFDWDLLRAHLKSLKAGGQVNCPVYDYSKNRRMQETEALGPCKVLIVEGIFVLWDAELRELFDMKIYLNVEADIRFIRRLHRDVRERGRSLDSIITQYYDTVRPMHRKFLEQTKQFADLVVGEETDIAAEVLSARVYEMLRQTQKSPAGPGRNENE